MKSPKENTLYDDPSYTVYNYGVKAKMDQKIDPLLTRRKIIEDHRDSTRELTRLFRPKV